LIKLHDKAKQEPTLSYKIGVEFENRGFTDTEIELVLPIVDQVRNTLDWALSSWYEKFCKKYAILTTDISFKFSILDESTEGDHSSNRSCDISTELTNVLLAAPQRGKVNIDILALSSIATSKKWNNADSIHSYSPAEFTSRITNVHHKQKTIVYDVLRSFREGTNIKKNSKTEKSVTDLVWNSNMYTEIEGPTSTVLMPNKLVVVFTPSRKAIDNLG
jgi:hypothetical protein